MTSTVTIVYNDVGMVFLFIFRSTFPVNVCRNWITRISSVCVYGYGLYVSPDPLGHHCMRCV